MEDAMDMSLDDYIKSFKQTKTEQKSTTNGLLKNDESKFKEGHREQVEDEEDDFSEELLLQCQEDDYVSLALSNEERSLVKTDTIDLRSKIGRLPNLNSQQWRLTQPNIMNSRPAGMPPLVHADAPQTNLNGNRNNWRNYNRNRNFSGRKYWNNHNNNNYHNNNRIQRFNNNGRSNLNSKNIKIVLEQLRERNPMILYSAVGASDLTIEASTSSARKPDIRTRFTMPSNFKPEQPQISIQEENSQPKSTDAIKNLLGVSEIGIKNETMPVLAAKLLDFLNGTNPTIHKPVYDMKIQKEIHEIQKKPLLYRCPGGEVVSSDGVGIPDCKIQPRESGISLNNRFA